MRKKIFTKQNVMPVAVLTVICLVVAALLGAVNMLTEKKIEDDRIAAISASLSEAFPGGRFADADVLPKDAPKTVTSKYNELDGKGYVVTLETSGYEKDSLDLTVGIDSEGKILKVILTKNLESKDTGKSSAYPKRFEGLDAKGVEGVDLISGITASSGAIKGAVYDALVVCGFAEAKAEAEEFDNGGFAHTSEEQVIAFAKEMLSGDYKKVDVAGMNSTVKGVYYNASADAHAIHIATTTKYIKPYNLNETEGIVIVDRSGKVAAVKMIEENIGYAEGTEPPTITKEYLQSFIGKHSSALDRVDLVTRATLTSNNFANAVRDAMEVLHPTPKYRVIGISLLSAVFLGLIGFGIYRYVKRRKANEQ